MTTPIEPHQIQCTPTQYRDIILDIINELIRFYYDGSRAQFYHHEVGDKLREVVCNQFNHHDAVAKMMQFEKDHSDIVKLYGEAGWTVEYKPPRQHKERTVRAFFVFIKTQTEGGLKP